MSEKNQKGLICFSLAGNEYALPLLSAIEVIKNYSLRYIPRSPSYIAGIINLRGKIVTILDIETVFGKKNKNNPKCILVAKVDSDKLIGLLVNGGVSIVHIDEKSLIFDKNTGIGANEKFIGGKCILDKRVIMILNLEKLLAAYAGEIKEVAA